MTKKSLQKNNEKQKGFSLLGVIAASSIIMIVLVAVTSSLVQTMKASRVSRDGFVAGGLAREGVELVKFMRDSNWLYYPENADGLVETSIKWRGDASSACAKNESCLRSICDGTWGIDAEVSGFGLKTSNGDLHLTKTSTSVKYSLSGSATPTFRRTVEVDTLTDTGDQAYMTGGNYLDESASACGSIIDSSVSSALKPLPVKVTSTVSWTDSMTKQPRSVRYSEVMYDWVKQRP